LTHDATSVVVTPLPQSAGKRSTAKLRWSQLPWQLPEPTVVEQLDESGKVVARHAIGREGQLMVIECPAEVYACRLTR
jgi:hypothetical protein